MSDELSKLRPSRVQLAIVTGYLLIIFVDYLYLSYYFDILRQSVVSRGQQMMGQEMKALIHSRTTATHFFPKCRKKCEKNTSFSDDVLRKRLRALSLVRYLYDLHSLFSSVVEHWYCNATESCEMDSQC